MIRTFRHSALQKLWTVGKTTEFKTVDTQKILDCLEVVDAASTPQDTAFTGFRYDEWTEGKSKRYGVMVSDHWLVSFGWSDGHATDVDLERIE
jgi:plasmid maintenance system killer protein